MGKAFCLTCGSKSKADTKDEAISLLNHAVGKTRGIRCGGPLAKIQTEGFSKSDKKTEPVEEKITSDKFPKDSPITKNITKSKANKSKE